MGRVAWPLGRGDTHLVHGTRRVRNQTATANAESWFAAAMNAAAAGIPVVPAHYLRLFQCFRGSLVAGCVCVW